jgi:hypothetical protein
VLERKFATFVCAWPLRAPARFHARGVTSSLARTNSGARELGESRVLAFPRPPRRGAARRSFRLMLASPQTHARIPWQQERKQIERGLPMWRRAAGGLRGRWETGGCRPSGRRGGGRGARGAPRRCPGRVAGGRRRRDGERPGYGFSSWSRSRFTSRHVTPRRRRRRGGEGRASSSARCSERACASTAPSRPRLRRELLWSGGAVDKGLRFVTNARRRRPTRKQSHLVPIRVAGLGWGARRLARG